MNFLASFISILLGSLIFHYLGLPWWNIAIISAIATFQFKLKPVYSFICGFLSILLFWFTHAYLINNANNGILLKNISEVMNLSQTTIWFLMLSIGSLVGGFSGLTGSFFRIAFLGTLMENLNVVSHTDNIKIEIIFDTYKLFIFKQ